MPEIMVRRETEDEKLALGATYMDDIDLIVSPIDGLLVLVAVKGGRQVCQLCGEIFNTGDPQYRGIEVSFSPGSPKLLLHSKCSSLRGKVRDKFRGLEIRRKLASIAKASAGIISAGVDSAKQIVER